MNSELNGVKCSKAGFLFGLFLVELYWESIQTSSHPLAISILCLDGDGDGDGDGGRSQLGSLPFTACEVRGAVIMAYKYPRVETPGAGHSGVDLHQREVGSCKETQRNVCLNVKC